MKPDFHIVVIGGGMVGACTAALLAAQREFANLRIAVVEAHPPGAIATGDEIDLRVSAISRGSEHILRSIEAWQLIPEQHLSPYDDMVVWDAQGKPRGAGGMHFSASGSQEPNLGHIVENRRIQSAIYECRSFHHGVTLLRADLQTMQFARDHVALELADGRKLTALLAIGSDGAASVSRKLAGIDTAGWAYDQHAFVTHVRTQHPHERTAWQRFLPAGPIAFLPLADGRSSIVWTTTPAHAGELVAKDPADAAAEIAAAIDRVFGSIEIAGPRGQFPLRLTHARSYCRERFVLVGDAAHAVHPLAGQGVNLGLLDAAALVETLVQALDASGSVEEMVGLRVLRRYERWRKSENLLAMGLIDGLNRLFGSGGNLVGWARRTGLTALDRSSLAKRFLMSRAMGTAGELPRAARTPAARH